MKSLKFVKEGNVQNKTSGITLIALVITIIVLLILVGVTIANLTGDNSILGQSAKSKEETIIGEEKEKVEIAYGSARTNKLIEDVTVDDLQSELDKMAKTEVTNNVDGTLNVLFKDTQHNYNVKNGKATIFEIID